jgi:hypothetical protein
MINTMALTGRSITSLAVSAKDLTSFDFCSLESGGASMVITGTISPPTYRSLTSGT